MSDNDSSRKNVSVERVLEALRQGKIESEHGLMRWSSNYTFLVSVTQEDLRLNAVYKPQKGERPLWDFPDGTLCYREVASFNTSHALGWQLVPPTVLRDGPRGLGSVQFFIDHNPEQNYFSFEKNLAPQLMRLSLFDYLVNNADRKGGHCLLDTQGHLWGIDHGITFHASHKLRTVIWDFAGQPVPADLLADVEKLAQALADCNSAFYKTMQSLLSETEIHAFEARMRRILKSKKYPQPGPGPNYPWPPV
ncbi:MAG: SCO1664 family protein [Chloroflexi bacterium]|nr:SCO1664 family protein [Chloroflexota bacterium]